MPDVPNVTTGDDITESWGDAVADEINGHKNAAAPHSGHAATAHAHTHAATTGQTANDHHAQLHAAQHATGQPDALTAAGIGAATSSHTHDELSGAGVFEGTCSAQAVANGTDDPLEWTEVTDVGGYHAGTSNAIVVPAGLGGVYVISASVAFSSGGTNRQLSIKKGAAVIANGVAATVGADRSVSWVGRLAAGDSITIVALANAAGVTATGQVGMVRVAD